MSLERKIVLVTDGGTAIGLAIAKRMTADGAIVHLNASGAKVLLDAVEMVGGDVIAALGDVTNADDLDRIFSSIEGLHARLDSLIINATRFPPLRLPAITAERFAEVFNRNVAAAVSIVQQALPLMSGGSTITLIGSDSDVPGTQGHSLYNATRAALLSLARTWTRELGSRGIRINVVSSGPTQSAVRDQGSSSRMKDLCASIPLGRLARVEEVASAVHFLASDESSFIAGIELCVDGGMAHI